MATYNWSVPTGKEILGSTKIKEADNKLKDTVDDLTNFVNGTGTHAGQGLTYDLVDKASTQTITGTKTFNNITITGEVTGNTSTATALETSRTISLTGDVTGSIGFDGTSNVAINTSIAVETFPQGGIVMWSGTIATIPSGWYLCDGANNTPNLRNRFIVGAGDTYSPEDNGGYADATLVEHSHNASTNTTGSHTHSYTKTNYSTSATDHQFAGSYNLSQAATNTSSAGNHSHTVTVDSEGVSATNKNLPPYFALAYIMKG